MAKEILSAERTAGWVQQIFGQTKLDSARLERPFKAIQKALALVSVAYFIGLILVLILLHFVGERNWLLGTMLYLPPQGWLLPLFFLVPLALLFHRGLWRLYGISILLVYFVYTHPRVSFHSAGKTHITVLTNNIGQRDRRTLLPFVQDKAPDIIALQEARFREGVIRKENPTYYVSAPLNERGISEEFVLASKFPIKDAGLVPDLVYRRHAVAAWFELDYNGTNIVVYNVHMPTPRPDFLSLRGRGFLVELVRGGGIYSSQVRKEYADAMRARVALIRQLAQIMHDEKRPCIALGDFNMPDTGYLHGVLSSAITDIFAAKGHGYGLTFPGVSSNPLTLFGPWLRIDYIFANDAWKPLSCEVEPHQNAQHLAVAAELELVAGK